MRIPSYIKPTDPNVLHQQALQRIMGQPRPGVSSTMPVPQAAPPPAAAPGPQRFEGFNQNRAQNINTSAKDAFAHYSNLAPTAPTNDKGALGSWFDQYIRPNMDRLGHRVSGATEGDKFTYGNHEGNFTVDYGRGAGAEGGALAWQAEAADDATRQRYAPPPATRQGDPMSRMPQQQSALMAQILAALQGQGTPQSVDPQALLLQQLMR